MSRQAETTLDLRALGRQPGAILERSLTVPAPAAMAVGMIGVPDDSPVSLDLTCQSVGDGVLVQGNATVTVTGQCGRCLASFSQPGSFDLQELYFYPGRGPVASDHDSEALFVVDDTVDLEPVLRAAVVLNLPFSPLCRDDCAGLCPICGVDLNEEGGHEHDETIDARWEALKGFDDSQSAN